MAVVRVGEHNGGPYDPASAVSPSQAQSDALFAKWCREHGLSPDRCDEANIWIRYAFEGALAAGIREKE